LKVKTLKEQLEKLVKAVMENEKIHVYLER
jgi:hypothetical protein